MNSSHFISSKFLNPPENCSQIPFWFLNGEIDGKEYSRQVEEMKKKGVCQAMPHPRYGMDRKLYLEETYWKAFDTLVEKAAEINTILHIYDEYNWPSGSAGGRVTDDRDKCGLGLGMISKTVESSAKVKFDGWTRGLTGWGRKEEIISILLIPVDHQGNIDIGLQIELPIPPAFEEVMEIEVPGSTKLIDKGYQLELLVFFTIRCIHPSLLKPGGGGRIDYLSPEPTAEFIKLTHEKYAKRYRKHFGKTIKSFFYDESMPGVAAPYTWTKKFPEEFKRIKGYDLMLYLPLLFYNGGDLTEKVRCDYWDTVSILFTENHVGQMADWCENNGVALTGHTYEELQRWVFTPDPMYTLRRQQWPGFDSLGGYKPYCSIKTVTSLPNITGKNILVCEALGLMGLWGASPRMMKQAYNQLAIAGVTHIIPHAFFQTVDNPKVECPPSFFEHNPYWKYYDRVNILTSRQCWINRQGHHFSQVAVLFPVVSWWGSCKGGRGQIFNTRATEPPIEEKTSMQSYTSIMNLLLSRHIDFDVIDSIALSEASIDDGKMKIASQRYRILVVPQMYTVRCQDMKQIYEFVSTGGHVVFAGSIPRISMEKGRNDDELNKLADFMNENAFIAVDSITTADRVWKVLGNDLDVVILSGKKDKIDISHRKIQGMEMYMLSNHSEDELQVRIWFNAKGCAELWNLEDGKIYGLNTLPYNNGCSIDLRFDPYESFYISFGRIAKNNLHKLQAYKIGAPTETQKVEGKWRFIIQQAGLENKWSCRIGKQEVQVPVMRTTLMNYNFAKPDYQNEKTLASWFEPEYDDSRWDKVHCFRQPLIYNDTNVRLFRMDIPIGATAIQLPIPVKGEYALYINGLLLSVNGYLSSQKGHFPIPQQKDKPGILAMESFSMAPDFGITSPITFICMPAEVEPGSWTREGYWWYSGYGVYQKDIDMKDNDGKTIYLNLGEVRECAEVWINGKLAGVRIWPPYRVDVTKYVRPGINRVTVIASNLLANQYSWDILGSRGEGKVLDSGLMGPVVVEYY